TVGSADFSASAANAPTIAATTDARNRPTKLGQNVVRDVRLSRDRLPTFGHHANPPAILSSLASMNAVCLSILSWIGGCVFISVEDASVEARISMLTVTTHRLGTSVRLGDSTDRGALRCGMHETRSDSRAINVSMMLLWLIVVSSS